MLPGSTTGGMPATVSNLGVALGAGARRAVASGVAPSGPSTCDPSGVVRGGPASIWAPLPHATTSSADMATATPATRRHDRDAGRRRRARGPGGGAPAEGGVGADIDVILAWPGTLSVSARG